MDKTEHETSPRICTRCGGVGTHYLRCPSLQLPAGHRIADESRGEQEPEPD